MMITRGILTALILMLCSWGNASENKREIVKDFFERLHKDPKATISAPPQKWGASNQLAPINRPRIGQEQKGLQSFGEEDHINKVLRFYPENDFVSDFDELTQPELQQAVLDMDMWSGDYWPTFKMGLANRYMDEDYPNAQSYNAYIDYFKSLGPIDFDNPEEMSKLSPAEKYDLLVLDSQMTLSNWSLFTAQSAYSQEDGEEKAMTWAGLCHGWAPAAYKVPRPLHSVTLDLGFGEVEFRPDDIKALATLLWAQAPVPNRFLGGRCNTTDPEKDEFDRIKDPECFDINPSSWHKVIVNHVGIRKKSFVLDATYDLEVWNQPIKSYDLTYYNPETQTTSQDARQALVKVEDFKSDIFKSYRSKKTAYVLGVVMNIGYLVETSPSSRNTDSAEHDAIQNARYFYDIELDKDHNMIGGEWYHTAHPDFIWTPIEGAKAESWFDRQLQGQWTGAVPPQQWQQAAKQASRQGFPLANIVNELVRRSRTAQSPMEKK